MPLPETSRELPGETPQEGPEKLSQPLGTVIRDSKGILPVPFALLRVVSFGSPSVFREVLAVSGILGGPGVPELDLHLVGAFKTVQEQNMMGS